MWIKWENICTRGIETHHGGDSQISKAYPQVDRAPRNCSKMHRPRSIYNTCFLVPWLKSVHLEPKVSGNNGNVRCRVVLCKKLPKANASEPRRHASPALRCGVDMNPDDVYGHERPQRRVRAVCDRRRRMSIVALGMPTTRAEKRTHRRNRVRKTQTGMMFVHKATETVWSRRTRGMLAGTKLRTLRGVCVYCNGDRARAENGMDALDTRL